MENQFLDNNQRQVLASLADVLIPTHGDMPCATDAGVTENLIDMVLGYRADLVPAFLDALTDCSGKEPSTALDELANKSPEKFEALTLLTSAAYFQSAKVKAALKYNPAPRTVVDDVDTYIDMLADVVERGFTIR